MPRLKPERPSDVYDKILLVIKICSRLLGVDVTSKDFKVNSKTAFVMVAIFAYYLCSVYTINKYIATDWTVMLDVFSPVSCNAQGMVKLMSALLYAKLYRKLAVQLGEIYEKYQVMGKRYEEKLVEWNRNMKRILITIGVAYSITALIIVCTPVVLYILKGERHLVLLCEVPGFDINSPHGYWVNNGFNAMCVLIAAFGLYAGDLYLFLYLTHSIFFFDIFKLKVSDLHEMIEQNAHDKRITKMVDDIVEWHQFYLTFNDNCNLLFFWTISAHIVCTTLGILSTLLIIMLKDWPGAYVYILVCFLWLYMYCILGTRIETCNDQFCSGIYDINWYSLDVRNQKAIRLMLMQSQAPRNITIAGIEPLSVSTALKITRTIYSIVMMVLRFQNK
ncbi:PREDICTED: odorant receptor 67d-like [Rhagoletis zephyria]|uniref:odorant receptor 67d-like n=1 Tax=Rhagoletis zephyria TaxID=28612 RepID=UPI0008116B66|nr:PREDICTED: odorant receptor 67d-like [Rhagoletis zephyria]